MIITHHAKIRLSQRVKDYKKDTIAEKALRHGLKQSQMKCDLRRYIESIRYKNPNADNIRIYDRKIFIFDGETLITVLNLPRTYKRTLNRIKRKIGGTDNEQGEKCEKGNEETKEES